MDPSAHDVVVITDTRDGAAPLVRALAAEGFACHEVPSAAAAAEGSFASPLLVVVVRGGSRSARRHVRAVLEIPGLYRRPLLLVGEAVTTYAGTLDKVFRRCLAAPRPLEKAGLLASVGKLLKDPDEGRTEESHAAAPDAAASADFILRNLDAADRPAEAPPKLFFPGFAGAVTEGPLGGRALALGSAPEYLPSTEYLPRNGRSSKLVATLCESLHQWQRARLHRTAFIATCLAKPAGLPGDLEDAVKGVGFLQALAWPAERPELYRREFVARGGDVVRDELSELVKEASVKLAIDHALPVEGRVAAALSRLHLGEEAPEDDLAAVAASCVLGADLVDRSCRASGTWQVSKAYELMVLLDRGALPALDPLVRCAVTKLLAEASAGTPRAGPIGYGSLAGDPARIEESRRLREDPPEPGETRVQLDSLRPGMRLSRPLLAWNGRLLLEGDLLFDEDLIGRVWRLSALVAVNPAMVET